MTADEYLKHQEKNNKIYELALNEAQKKKSLESMIKAEIRFIEEKIPPVELNKTISGQSVNFSMNKMQTASHSEPEVIFVQAEKITPENIFDKCRAKDSDGKPVDLKHLLKDNPEAIQKICDAINEATMSDLKKHFGNQKGLQMLDSATHIGFGRTPESVKNPDVETANILARAKKFVSSQSKSKLSLDDQLVDSKNLELEASVSQKSHVL